MMRRSIAGNSKTNSFCWEMENSFHCNILVVSRSIAGNSTTNFILYPSSPPPPLPSRLIKCREVVLCSNKRVSESQVVMCARKH